MLGIRHGLSGDVREAFNRTGTGHLLAVSGLHVGVLLGIMLVASTALLGGSRWALLAPLAVLWLYALLTGMAPPVVRAAIMGSLYLENRFTGRQSTGFPALALAAGVMAGLEPRLLEDVSFQLSFAAMASLLLLAPGIQERLDALAALLADGRAQLPGAVQRLNAALAVGVAASIGTLPLIASPWWVSP